LGPNSSIKIILSVKAVIDIKIVTMEKCYHSNFMTYEICLTCNGYNSYCMLYVTKKDIQDHLIDFKKLSLEKITSADCSLESR